MRRATPGPVRYAVRTGSQAWIWCEAAAKWWQVTFVPDADVTVAAGKSFSWSHCQLANAMHEVSRHYAALQDHHVVSRIKDLD